jgi:hypothetical protein
MIGGRSIGFVVVALVIVTVAVSVYFAVWSNRTQRAEVSGPIASPKLKDLISQALVVVEAGVKGGEDIIPFSIIENGKSGSSVSTFADAKTFGPQYVEGLDYANSVTMGRAFLKRENAERAVFVRSVEREVAGKTSSAVLIEAYERGYPGTFRYVREYRLAPDRKSGIFTGELIHISNGPPGFATALPN